DTVSGSTTSGSLRDAILAVNGGAATNVVFSPGAAGTITLGSPLPMINSSVTLDATGAGAPVTVDGGSTVRVFFVNAGTVSLANLTIANGNATGGTGGASVIDNAGGGGGGLGAGGGL